MASVSDPQVSHGRIILTFELARAIAKQYLAHQPWQAVHGQTTGTYEKIAKEAGESLGVPLRVNFTKESWKKLEGWNRAQAMKELKSNSSLQYVLEVSKFVN